MHTGAFRHVVTLTLLGALIGLVRPAVAAPDNPPAAAPAPPALSLTPDAVLDQLNRTLSWYTEARTVMRSVNESGGLFFGLEDEQTARLALQRAFDVARAQADLLARSESQPTGATPSRPGANDHRARLEADIKSDEQELAQLARRADGSSARTRPAIEREQTAVKNRLAFNRLRLDFITKLRDLDSGGQGDANDLPHRIQALQDAVPELRPAGAPSPSLPQTSATMTGTWSLIRRLFALQGSRSSLDHLQDLTTALQKQVDDNLGRVQSAVRPAMRRLRALAEPAAGSRPSTDGGPAATPGFEQSEQEFRDLLDRVKLLSPVVIPLRGESDLLRRMSSNLTGARRFVDRVFVETLQNLGFQLFGLVLAIVAILIGAVLWRVAANRYLQNTYHRRLALATRNAVVGCAIALVVVFHFTSELTALVTALGFAAAGIAFALQNVVLSVAGYFSMVAPNGIRVGDRVSLQGPFGFVHGDVLDIGLVRIRLRELGGEGNTPTGRTVVFPNAVVFTGSFYKENPAPPAAAAR
jgi:hypothetical protein